MRWYQQHWEEIKRVGYKDFALPKSDHPRIIRGIRKEYYRDDAFRLQAAEDGITVSIHTSRFQDSLRIWLHTI